MNKHIILGVLSFVLFQIAKAQQDAMFTHYMYNTLAVNPGYAGTRDVATITALNRNQWVGFDGAPVTQTLTMHSPFFNNKIGGGLSILNDKAGPIKTTSVYADFAYHLKINDKSKLSFGLKAGVNLLQSSLTQLKLDQGNDNSFQNNLIGKALPNFGFGLYYHTERFYLGASIPRLLENNFTTKTSTGTTDLLSQKRHYFFIGGALFNLPAGLKLKATSLLKIVPAAPIELDVTGEFILKDKLTLGIMGRSLDGVGFLVGYQFSEQLRAGYSFDLSMTKLIRYNYGSHEIMLMYDLILNNKGKIRSPRYF